MFVFHATDQNFVEVFNTKFICWCDVTKMLIKQVQDNIFMLQSIDTKHFGLKH